MDGTAGRQFVALRRRLAQLGVQLVVAALPPHRRATWRLPRGVRQLSPLHHGSLSVS